MSELKFKVGDVCLTRSGAFLIIRSIYDGLINGELHLPNGTYFRPESAEVATNWRDIVSVIGNVSDFDRLKQLEEQVAKLQAFKSYVHDRLDAAGIDPHHEGNQEPHGCRIGSRLDDLITFKSRAQQLETALEQELDLLKRANSAGFVHTHGEPTYPQSVEWVERAKNEVPPALETALAAKGGAA